MQLRPLGFSGLLVSPICLGTMTFGTPVGEADAIRLTHAAIDLGINFVDTANVYEGYSRYLGSPVGVKKLEQLQDAVAACEVVIPSEQIPRLDAICPLPWRQPDPIRG